MEHGRNIHRKGIYSEEKVASSASSVNTTRIDSVPKNAGKNAQCPR